MSSKIQRKLELNVPQKALFQAITDFEAYPQFLPEVVGAKRENFDADNTTVTFELEIIKRFQYVLEFRMRNQDEVAWKLIESNFFKKNSGKWLLKKLTEETTEVTYELEVEFGFFVPKLVSTKLTEVTLPKMFELFEKRAKAI